MDVLINIIGAVLQLGFDLISIAFRIIVAMIAAGMAFVKRRNVWIWGLGTLIFPWAILFLIFVPRRYPKFQGPLGEDEAFKHKNPVIASIMALSAIIAKADGSISKDEISFIKRFVSRQFNISSEELNEYAGAFDYGKNHPESYKEFTGMITEFYARRDIIIAIAYLLVCTAMQDGSISDNEDQLLRKILRELGLSEYEYISIKQSFNQQNNSYHNNYYGSQAADSRETLIKKYSEVLGVSEQAEMSEIKRAYRKLVKQYHPDELSADSMPDNYKKFAQQKIVEINEAYEYLKKVKQA